MPETDSVLKHVRTEVTTVLICGHCSQKMYFWPQNNFWDDAKTPQDQMRLMGFEEYTNPEGYEMVLCRWCRLKISSPRIDDVSSIIHWKGYIRCFTEGCKNEYAIDLMGAMICQGAIHRSTEMIANEGWTALQFKGNTPVAYCPDCSKTINKI